MVRTGSDPDPTGAQLTDLIGRHEERDVIDGLLAAAKSGRSGTLLVRGAAGIGKSAMLDHARESALAAGFRVMACAGVESETQFAFAGLQQLVTPVMHLAGTLPEPQQAALGVALGLRDGVPPDAFLVGLATLNLLAEVAEQGALLCVVDDAQWLDQISAQILAFVARRIAAERIALVIASRDADDGHSDVFASLATELRLRGLDNGDSRTLLAKGLRARIDDDVRERILTEACGNPLALLELPRSAEATEFAGGYELPDVLGVPRRIEETFRRRSADLSADAQMLLLVAAADPTGDAMLLWRAIEWLGIDSDAAAPAEASGLLEIGARARFRHPLVRSAVYRTATPTLKRRAHEALAAVTDPFVDSDRRAMHRAQALVGNDEGVAMELERSAERTLARGGVAASAAFLQRAAEITPEPAARARRALEAAHAKHDAAAYTAATELLAVASAGPLDDIQRARVQLLGARLAFHRTQGSEAPKMLLAAAETLAPLDASLARETYLHALDATMIIGVARTERGVRDVAEAALDAPAPPEPPLPSDLLLDGLVATFTEGYEAGLPAVRRALEAFRDHGFDGEAIGQMGSRRWLWLATRTAAGVFDKEQMLVLARRNVRLARQAGALTTLPGALAALSSAFVLCGDFAQAAELASEGAAITEATRAVPQRYAQLFLAGWRGQEEETLGLVDVGVHDSGAPRVGAVAGGAYYARAVLYNGRGDYSAATAAAERACQSDEISNSSLALPELVEAAVRAGRPALAASAAEELGSRAAASGTAWALGLAARSRALITADTSSEEDYRESIEWLTTSGVDGHLARTHLVYGEWLRRQGRRQESREQLRIAHDLLSKMGADAFAERAARELRATGEKPRRRSHPPADGLTDHELQIARLVATGATSREVGAQLFLSPRTIEAHLRNIFRKLGISSRRQLRESQLS